MVKEYGRALAHDPDYAKKAARVSELTRDLSRLLQHLLPCGFKRIRHDGRLARAAKVQRLVAEAGA